MSHGKFVQKNGYGGSAGQTNKINANAEVLTVDVEDLSNVVLHLIQLVDSGTVTLVTEYTLDGTYWAVLDASTAAGDFAAGVGAVVAYTLADAAGMPIPAKKVRIRASAYGASGEYLLSVGGWQRPGFA